jgi:glucose/arabinose dehydrogenase
MFRTSLALSAAGLALSAAVPLSAQAPVHRSAYHDYRVVTVVDGLEHPWSIAFLPGGDLLVTERPGRLRIVRNGKLLPNPVPGVPKVLAQGQGGLLDVVPHPDFASNRLLYLSFSKPIGDGSSATTAVVRGRFENDRLTDVEEVFEAASRGRGHYGSRLAFDRDGYLFITVGDRQAPPRGDLAGHPAQDLSNHHGTVNRLHDDGRVPADNPFVNQAGARPEIWSYGHRNQQGLAIHPETGDVWANEHGPQGGDELNLIKPGLNYGWPVVGYGVNYRSGSAIHEGTHKEGMEPPVHFWVPSIATSGLLIYTGNRFPDWRGSMFVGGLSGQQLARITMDGQEVVLEETLVHRMGRIRDVRQGPDGYIYLAIDHRGGEPTPIVRLEPANER